MGERFFCKHCGRKYAATRELAGQQFQCKQCQRVIQVPDLDARSARPPEDVAAASNPAEETAHRPERDTAPSESASVAAGVRFECADCGHAYDLPAKAAGRRVRCPNCKVVSRAPDSNLGGRTAPKRETKRRDPSRQSRAREANPRREREWKSLDADSPAARQDVVNELIDDARKSPPRNEPAANGAFDLAPSSVPPRQLPALPPRARSGSKPKRDWSEWFSFDLDDSYMAKRYRRSGHGLAVIAVGSLLWGPNFRMVRSLGDNWPLGSLLAAVAGAAFLFIGYRKQPGLALILAVALPVVTLAIGGTRIWDAAHGGHLREAMEYAERIDAAQKETIDRLRLGISAGPPPPQSTIISQADNPPSAAEAALAGSQIVFGAPSFGAIGSKWSFGVKYRVVDPAFQSRQEPITMAARWGDGEMKYTTFEPRELGTTGRLTCVVWRDGTPEMAPRDYHLRLVDGSDPNGPNLCDELEVRGGGWQHPKDQVQVDDLVKADLTYPLWLVEVGFGEVNGEGRLMVGYLTESVALTTKNEPTDLVLRSSAGQSRFEQHPQLYDHAQMGALEFERPEPMSRIDAFVVRKRAGIDHRVSNTISYTEHTIRDEPRGTLDGLPLAVSNPVFEKDGPALKFTVDCARTEHSRHSSGGRVWLVVWINWRRFVSEHDMAALGDRGKLSADVNLTGVTRGPSYEVYVADGPAADAKPLSNAVYVRGGYYSGVGPAMSVGLEERIAPPGPPRVAAAPSPMNSNSPANGASAPAAPAIELSNPKFTRAPFNQWRLDFDYVFNDEAIRTRNEPISGVLVLMNGGLDLAGDRAMVTMLASELQPRGKFSALLPRNVQPLTSRSFAIEFSFRKGHGINGERLSNIIVRPRFGNLGVRGGNAPPVEPPQVAEAAPVQRTANDAPAPADPARDGVMLRIMNEGPLPGPMARYLAREAFGLESHEPSFVADDRPISVHVVSNQSIDVMAKNWTYGRVVKVDRAGRTIDIAMSSEDIKRAYADSDYFDEALSLIAAGGPVNLFSGFEMLEKVVDPQPSHRERVLSAVQKYAETRRSDGFNMRLPQFFDSAVRVIGVWGTERNVPFLVKALRDEGYFFKDDAIKAIGKIGGDAAIAALAKVPISHARQAIEALTEIGPPAEEAVLEWMRKPVDNGVLQSCIRALELLGTSRSFETLDHLGREHADKGVRDAAARAAKFVRNRR